MLHADESNLKIWDDIFRSRAWGRYPPEDLVRFIARNFYKAPDRRAVRILEMGCGPGANVWFMAREGFSVSAIDCSPAAIAQLGQRLSAEAIPFDPAELKVGDFSRLPWGDGLFDAVVDVEAIAHNPLPVVRQVMAEAHRVLKPGGLMFSRMFGDRTSGANRDEEARGPLQGVGVLHYFTRADVAEVFSIFASAQHDWLHRADGPEVEYFEWLSVARK